VSLAFAASTGALQFAAARVEGCKPALLPRRIDVNTNALGFPETCAELEFWVKQCDPKMKPHSICQSDTSPISGDILLPGVPGDQILKDGPSGFADLLDHEAVHRAAVGVFNEGKADVDAFIAAVFASTARLDEIAVALLPLRPIGLSEELEVRISVQRGFKQLVVAPD
jgi:hypothetical protein